jgi:hypothetical protein
MEHFALKPKPINILKVMRSNAFKIFIAIKPKKENGGALRRHSLS